MDHEEDNHGLADVEEARSANNSHHGEKKDPGAETLLQPIQDDQSLSVQQGCEPNMEPPLPKTETKKIKTTSLSSGNDTNSPPERSWGNPNGLLSRCTSSNGSEKHPQQHCLGAASLLAVTSEAAFAPLPHYQMREKGQSRGDFLVQILNGALEVMDDDMEYLSDVMQ